ncbi:hypothetical protein [Sphingomicrobium clamense]|uniref:Uncharacterized protein n=1 Tax=Sphingomicrobium clamense TaxID=2851013 RepID=A0ABS6V6S3_9SPHN|nr:hypothetical protein [Sphingomicrobium sp. B8]MBW0145264.1 hypothetical protein [Sphingomicrobium sp. B8]
MSEHKAFASLSSGLLARKGSARPAMRRQGFGQVGPGGLDDLGWNDLGDPDYPDQDNEAAMARMAQADQLAPVDEPEGEGGEVVDAFKRNPISMLSPASSPVHDQREEIEAAFGYDENEEHHDGDDVFDETAELWEGDEDEAMDIDLGVGKSEPASFDEEPKLQRTVADLIPQAAPAEGTSAPLSDFSHLPSDLSNFGKPATPVEQPAAEDTQPEPTAASEEPEAIDAPEIYEEVSPPEGLVPFASDDEDADAPVAEEGPSVWDEPVEAEDTADEPVADADAPGFSGPLGPVLDALAASEQPAEPVVEETAEEEKAPVAIEPKLPDFEPVPFETGAELEAEDVAEEPLAEVPVEDEPVENLAEPVAFDAPVEDAIEPVVVETPAVEEPERIAASLDEVEPIASRSNAKGKAAFTLRLDQDVHLKLRLACALTGLSAQKFVSQALDRALSEMPELDELAEKSAKRAE